MRKKYIVLIPETEDKYINGVCFSFGKKNVKIIKESTPKKEVDELISNINKNYEKVIFFELTNVFSEMLPCISKKVKVSWIFKYPIAYFSKIYIYNYFLQTLENKKRDLINDIYVLDYDLYYTFKNKVKYLKLDVEEKKKSEVKNEIGIIGMDYEEFSSFYNMLSACTFIDITNVKVENKIDATKNFEKDFNIKIKKCSSYSEILENSKVNLYTAFAGISPIVVLESLDQGIPCIVGNTNMFDSNAYLKEQLVLKSDDDINEIVDKIKNAIENKKEILEEYKKYRNEYKKEVKKLMEKFNS